MTGWERFLRWCARRRLSWFDFAAVSLTSAAIKQGRWGIAFGVLGVWLAVYVTVMLPREDLS